MKPLNKIILSFLCLGIINFGLCACATGQIDGNYNSTSEATKYELNTTNASSYFNIEVSDAKKSYSYDFNFKYKVHVSTKGRYKTSDKVTLQFMVTFTYSYKPSLYGSNITIDSSSMGTLVLEDNKTNGSNEYSITFTCQMSQIINCTYSTYFVRAKGYLISY